MASIYIHKTNRRIKPSSYKINLRPPRVLTYSVDDLFSPAELEEMFRKPKRERIKEWIIAKSHTIRNIGQ